MAVKTGVASYQICLAGIAQFIYDVNELRDLFVCLLCYLVIYININKMSIYMDFTRPFNFFARFSFVRRTRD